MSTSVSNFRNRTKIQCSVDKFPAPRTALAWAVPTFNDSLSSMIQVSLQAIVDQATSGIRVQSLGVLPGAWDAVWQLEDVCWQGDPPTVMPTPTVISVPVVNGVFDLTITHPMAGATHTIRVVRKEGDQATAFPTATITTPVDPTLANIQEVQSAVAAAEDAASAALIAANAATTIINGMTSDNILSTNEKPSIMVNYTTLLTPKSSNDLQAYALLGNASALQVAYDTALANLTSYLEGLTPAWNNLTQNTPIVGSTFRGRFTSAYAAEAALLNGFVEKTKTLAEAAQTGVDHINSVDSLTNSDKIALMNMLRQEYGVQSILDMEALGASVSHAAYDSSITALESYLTTLYASEHWKTTWPDGITLKGVGLLTDINALWQTIAQERKHLENALLGTKLGTGGTAANAVTLGGHGFSSQAIADTVALRDVQAQLWASVFCGNVSGETLNAVTVNTKSVDSSVGSLSIGGTRANHVNIGTDAAKTIYIGNLGSQTTFNGTVTVPTPTAGDNSTLAASTKFVTGGIAAAVAAETSSRATADSSLSSQITQEATNRAEAISSAVDAETSIRAAADALLAPKASPIFSGIPLAPTALMANILASGVAGQLATCAFVMSLQSQGTPLMNGNTGHPSYGGGGTFKYASWDHVHPTDTSRLSVTTAASTYATQTSVNTALGLKAPLDSPSFTGTPYGPTPDVNNNTLRLATTAFVIGQAGTALPLWIGSASVGTSTLFAREDHVHPVSFNNAYLNGTCTAPTPTEGDTSTKISTTQFVANALANALAAAPVPGRLTPEYIYLASATNDLASHAGQNLNVTILYNTGIATITLPPAVNVGQEIWIFNLSNSRTVTLNKSATGTSGFITISSGQFTSSNTLTLPANTSLVSGVGLKAVQITTPYSYYWVPIA